jgi:hypothetical protein
VKFWTSSWLNGTVLTAMFSNLYDHSCWKNWTVAATITNGQWIQDLMHNITPPLVSQYTLLWELVQAVDFSDNTDEDGYQGYHVSWTRQKGTRRPTKRRPTRFEGTSQGGHNRGGLEDNYRIKSCKYGK